MTEELRPRAAFTEESVPDARFPLPMIATLGEGGISVIEEVPLGVPGVVDLTTQDATRRRVKRIQRAAYR